MMTKVFKSGNSMAVRIPKQIHLQAHELEISQQGDVIILRPVTKNLSGIASLMGKCEKDFFLEGRKDLPPQKRENF